MAFPMPHPACLSGSPNDSCDSPEQIAIEKTYDRYLNSYSWQIAKRIDAQYMKYKGVPRSVMTDQQIADAMTAYVDALTRTHQEKAAKDVQREAVFARADTLAPTAVPRFVGKMLKAERVAANMSQGELAGILGVTTGAVSHYELGLTPIPPERIETLAALFGKTPAEFTAPKP